MNNATFPGKQGSNRQGKLHVLVAAKPMVLHSCNKFCNQGNDLLITSVTLTSTIDKTSISCIDKTFLKLHKVLKSLVKLQMAKLAKVPANIQLDVAVIKLHSSQGIWQRKRLIKTASGQWVRVGRMSKVHYH